MPPRGGSGDVRPRQPTPKKYGRFIFLAAAIEWLRYKQHCPLVCWERTPFKAKMCRPDVLGVTKQRTVVEIEIKQTMADFKNNSRKRGMQWREQGWAAEYPARFYFLVPPRMVDKVKPLLKDGQGLMTLREPTDRTMTDLPEVEVVKGATSDPRATKLAKFQVARMVMHQTGTLHRAVAALARAQLTEEDLISATPRKFVGAVH